MINKFSEIFYCTDQSSSRAATGDGEPAPTRDERGGATYVSECCSLVAWRPLSMGALGHHGRKDGHLPYGAEDGTALESRQTAGCGCSQLVEALGCVRHQTSSPYSRCVWICFRCLNWNRS